MLLHMASGCDDEVVLTVYQADKRSVCVAVHQNAL